MMGFLGFGIIGFGCWLGLCQVEGYEYLEEVVLDVAGFVVAVECGVLNVVEGDGGAVLAQGVGGCGWL